MGQPNSLVYYSILSFTTAITKNKKEKRESRTAQKPHLSDDWNSNKITMAQDRRKVQTGRAHLKVSKSRKQIILSTHTPKKQRKFSHFFALGPKYV